jgi:hypothetical protein
LYTRDYLKFVGTFVGPIISFQPSKLTADYTLEVGSSGNYQMRSPADGLKIGLPLRLLIIDDEPTLEQLIYQYHQFFLENSYQL